jgi:TolB-like protein
LPRIIYYKKEGFKWKEVGEKEKQGSVNEGNRKKDQRTWCAVCFTNGIIEDLYRSSMLEIMAGLLC